MPLNLRDPQFNPADVPLSELHSAVWTELASACGNLQHGWRLPSLATVSKNFPQQRLVVLRQVDPAKAHLVAHTDLRSPKIEQLRQNPHASWLFYDPQCRVQLVMNGTAALHFDDSFADQQWAASTPTNRIAFLAEKPPGMPSASPSINVPEAIQNRVPSPEESAPGRANFVAILSTIDEIDLLFIRRSGNLRAHFSCNAENWEQTWVEP